MTRNQQSAEWLCRCGCGQRTSPYVFNNAPLGQVKGQPRRFVVGHNRRVPADRLWRVEDRGFDTPCWTWQLACTTEGYGRAWREGKDVAAHRFYYEQAKGPIPDGLELDHLCRVRNCVNPDHLEPVTGTENKRRGSGTKLSPLDIRMIRASRGWMPARVIADDLRITESYIYKLCA